MRSLSHLRAFAELAAARPMLVDQFEMWPDFLDRSDPTIHSSPARERHRHEIGALVLFFFLALFVAWTQC